MEHRPWQCKHELLQAEGVYMIGRPLYTNSHTNFVVDEQAMACALRVSSEQPRREAAERGFPKVLQLVRQIAVEQHLGRRFVVLAR